MNRVGGDGVYIEDPRSLHISWQLQCLASTLACRRLQQQAYRVAIHTVHTRQMVHDTGKQEGRVPVAELELPMQKFRTGDSYQLSVQVWTNSSTPSSTTTVLFRTAVLSPSNEWLGQWIGGFTQLQGQFQLDQPANAVEQATAFASGVGCFSLTVNTKPVSSSVLDPGFNYVPSVRMLYRSYNVTTLIADGNNTVGAKLGFCKYGYQGSFCEGAHGSLATCRSLNAFILIRFKDGTNQTFATQPSPQWVGTTDGNPIRYTHLYHGEIFDARMTKQDPAWQPVEASPLVKQLGPLALHTSQPMGTSQTFPVVSVKTVQAANRTFHVFDFGHNIAGFATLQWGKDRHVPAGTVVTLAYGEVLNPDGTVNQPWGTGPGINQANQTDQYTASGDPEGETWTPLFTYHGFRYVGVAGLPFDPDTTLLNAAFVHTLMPRTGRVHFNATYDILNGIQDAILFTQVLPKSKLPTS